MRTQQPTSPPPPSTSGRRPLLLALVLTLLLIGGASAFLATRGSDNASPQAAPPPPVPPTTSPPTTSLDERAEVVARLREILRIRDEAYGTRNAFLLTQIYSNDCPCLRSDREIIQKMKSLRIVWKGVSTSIKVKKAERINPRLWILTTSVTGASFKIEKESGERVREVASGSDVVQFLLTKPSGQQDWLLGKGSFIRGVD
jgi:hypothetical protein